MWICKMRNKTFIHIRKQLKTFFISNFGIISVVEFNINACDRNKLYFIKNINITV